MKLAAKLIVTEYKAQLLNAVVVTAGGAITTAFLNERQFWLFDCFEGLPTPSREDIKNDDGVPAKDLWFEGWDKGSVEKVKELYFDKLKMPVNNVHIIKGLFEDTIPHSKRDITSIALLHLDGDWYESTKVCLENLFDKVVNGGYIVIDDYGHWRGCKKAVDEFLKQRHLQYTLERVDYTRVFFRKQ